MNTLELLLAVLSLGLAIGLGAAIVAWMRAHTRAGALSAQLAEVAARETQAALGEALLKAQARDTAEDVAQKLVARATETFQAQDRVARERLEAQLKPVAETLKAFQDKVEALEKARVEDSGGLKAQIAALMQASVETQGEARKLSAALRRGAGVQGRWGEQTLRNVLDMAGLQARFDFSEQTSLDSEEGRRRPDVTVRLPGGGAFVIDAKVSLTAFLEAMEAADEVARDQALVRHAQSLKTHMTGLAAKAYWDQFKTEGSPDFVAMFVPGDGFLASALERQPDLLSEAMGRRVLIVTPTTLFALCKAVAYGWRAEEQTRNANDVAALGRELYRRLAVMGDHISGLGRALGQAVGKYNQFVGSLEAQVMVQARRFEDLQVDHQGRDLPELQAVESTPRSLARPELTPAKDA